ncbi:MAG: type II toxin-antitoxin system MqsA family antitoxin [Oscillospiraceae bacterium]|nr:type II toxin-antitoxin system MqsA family antitoxin [Oscillospiraceae bacterium]
MKCFFCNGTLENDFTTHVTEIGDRVIIIRKVPCLKCNQCNEVSYTGVVCERLETIVNTVRNTLTEVAILHYSDEAA